ncbi:hypothetical protein WJX73_005023 [Symbiochloris irregularis]|uniref:Uncharacterized protein n=1 Tax=Symbiochloris irregularis TaxID=706552 RepID=A0AAW1NLN7_9CHLO
MGATAFVEAAESASLKAQHSSRTALRPLQKEFRPFDDARGLHACILVGYLHLRHSACTSLASSHPHLLKRVVIVLGIAKISGLGPPGCGRQASLH